MTTPCRLTSFLQAAIKAHSNLKHQLPQLAKTSFPYVFAHHADRNREIPKFKF